MLHREANTNDVVEAILLSEVLVERYSFELLTEQDDESKEAPWVVVRHREMTLALKTSQEALDEERVGEGVVLKFAVFGDIGHQRHQSDLRIRALSLLVDGFERQFDFTGRVVLVQVNHLEVAVVAVQESLQVLIQLVLEHRD